jgi:hypothetical protein
MRGGAVAGGLLRGRPPDGASCNRRAGLQQCKSFVEMCIVSCLSVSSACVCGRGAATWGCPRRRLPCRRDSPAPLYRTSVTLVLRTLTQDPIFLALLAASTSPLQDPQSASTAQQERTSMSRGPLHVSNVVRIPVLFLVPLSSAVAPQKRTRCVRSTCTTSLQLGRLSLHSGIEFGRSRTGVGSSGGGKRGMV